MFGRFGFCFGRLWSGVFCCLVGVLVKSVVFGRFGR